MCYDNEKFKKHAKNEPKFEQPLWWMIAPNNSTSLGLLWYLKGSTKSRETALISQTMEQTCYFGLNKPKYKCVIWQIATLIQWKRILTKRRISDSHHGWQKPENSGTPWD